MRTIANALEHYQKYCSHSLIKKAAVFLRFGFVSAQLQGLLDLLLRRSLAKTPKILAANGYRIFSNALITFFFGAATFLSAFTSAGAEQSSRFFQHPDRIRYDSRCVTIDGKDVFLYSGAFHYFRCPKELWRERFQKIKDAGFNCVETYAAWNWHEREMPTSPDDHSKADMKDLEEWLTMAEDFGFYIIVRPGPYICAEWDTGGFPQWLLTKKPANFDGEWLRSDNPTYLEWCKHWYDEVCPVIAKHQVTHKAKGKPGVIFVQLENEYDFAKFSDQVKINQLKALADAARANDIDVPFITCWTKQVRGSSDPTLRQMFDCCNFYPRWNVDKELNSNIPRLRTEQPDAPLGTTEMQGGWFSQVGGMLSEKQEGVTASQINYITLLALAQGETLINYYMLYGGSNPGDWGARNMTTTYDYNAPIREWGGVGDRYDRVWSIGHMLREHGARLARADKVDCDVNVTDGTGGAVKDVTVIMRRATDGSRYLFIRTPQHLQPRSGVAHVTPKTGGENVELVFNFELEPFGSKILYLAPGVNDAAQGQWLLKPAPVIARPANLPTSVPITSAKWQNDPGPAHWVTMQAGQNLAQLHVYDSDFVFYKATMNDTLKTNLVVTHPGNDTVMASVNGKLAPPIKTGGGNTVFRVPVGFDSMLFLYENLGHANGGVPMENLCGIFDAKLTAPPKRSRQLTAWKMHEVNTTTPDAEVSRGFVDDDWATVPLNKLDANSLEAGHTAVYRATIGLTDEDFENGKLTLSFNRIDDLGWIYVNGRLVGETTDWSREYTFDVMQELQPGMNVVAVVVRNADGAGGITAARLGTAAETRNVRLEAFGRPSGVEQEWWRPGFSDKHWDPVQIGSTSTAPEGTMLAWYRMNFELPSRKSHVWVPWRLHLNAAGNGFIYLNGHALGRYWQAGPQHDFYLPECWLNFGKANLIAVSLRPLTQGVSIQSASVEPYAEFAEKR